MNFWQTITRPVIGLAPMDGVTDAAFRYVTAKHGGPDVILTEFVNIQSALYSPQTLLQDFAYSEIERPVVAQIYGKTPELFYQVAHIVCALGFDGLDINMGCPAKKVAATGCGAALIRTPELAREIIRAAKQGVRDWYNGQSLAGLKLRDDMIAGIARANQGRSGLSAPVERRPIPISVKTRLGYDRVVIDDWLRTLLEEDPAAISLHGRTLAQGYKGEADWHSIARAVEFAKGSATLILGNGDVQNLRDAHRRIRATHVDGVLIGRGAQGDPWLFREKARVKEALRLDREPLLDDAPIPLAERFRLIIEHCERFEQLSDQSRFVAMRKHLTWYCRNFRGAAEMRAQMVRAQNSRDVQAWLNEYLQASMAGEPAPPDSAADSIASHPQNFF